MSDLTCHKANSLYDGWRDRVLEPREESALIAHLETCDTCSMEFERRDEALEALARTFKAIPGPSPALHMNVRSLAVRRHPVLPWVASAACLVVGLWLGTLVTGEVPHTDVASWLKREPSRDSIEERLRRLEEAGQQGGHVESVLAAYEAGRILERELGDANLSVHRGDRGSLVTVLRGNDPDNASLEALLRDHNDLGPALDPLLMTQQAAELGRATPGENMPPELVNAIVHELVKKQKRGRDPFEGGVQ
ncbi:MAG: anti-sigma factor [Planctomycetota bacterium]